MNGLNKRVEIRVWTNGTAILKKEEEAVTFMLYPNGPIRNFILYFVFEVSS